MNRFPLVVAMMAVAVIAIYSAPAQEAPTGEDIMNRSIEAAGGLEAMERIKVRKMVGSVEIEGMGIKGDMTIWQVRPDRSHTTMEMAGLGKIIQCVDGETAWEINPMTGPRVYEGAEREMVTFSARFDESNYKDVFNSIEAAGEEEIDGETCYKVIAKSEAIGEIAMYCSKETGLLKRTAFTVTTQMGPVDTQVDVSDYKEIDGVKIPMTMRQTVMAMMNLVMKFTSIEHNIDVPEGLFTPPDEVKALIEQSAGEAD